LNSDKEIICAAVKELGGVVNDDMSVKDVVLAGIKRYASFLSVVDEDLKANKDVVLAAALT